MIIGKLIKPQLSPLTLQPLGAVIVMIPKIQLTSQRRLDYSLNNDLCSAENQCFIGYCTSFFSNET